MEALISAWGPLGIGGILAAIIFWFYREDRRISEERLISERKVMLEWITSAKVSLESLAERQLEQARIDGEIQREHIKVLTGLSIWLKAKNGGD